MASLNRVTLIGNLTRDPELKYTPKGTAVAEIGMAINRVWYDDNKQKQEDVTFIDVTLWGKTAEIASQYLGKGSSLYIEGRLQLESWDDKETGKKRSKLKVVGESMQFLDSKKQVDSQREPQGVRSPEWGQREAPRNSGPGMPAAPARDNGGNDFDADDDVPFSPNPGSNYF